MDFFDDIRQDLCAAQKHHRIINISWLLIC